MTGSVTAEGCVRSWWMRTCDFRLVADTISSSPVLRLREK